MKAKLVALVGWLLVPVVAAGVVWSVISWLYPVAPLVEVTPQQPKAPTVWLTGLDKHWVQADPEQAVSPQQAMQIQPSSLVLTVQGLLFSNQQQRSVVMLRYQNKDLTLGVGDELTAGVVLSQIQADALIFSRNGQLERVEVQLEQKNGQGLTGLDNSSPAVKSTSGVANASSSRSTASAAVGQQSVNQQPVSQAVVGSRVLEETFGPEFRQSLLGDPLQLMSYITLVPQSEGGQLQGFELRPGTKPELFQHFGLQAGDVLVAVEGKPVSDTAAMLSLTSTLSSAAAVEVDLLRNSELVRIRLEME